MRTSAWRALTASAATSLIERFVYVTLHALNAIVMTVLGASFPRSQSAPSHTIALAIVRAFLAVQLLTVIEVVA
jgi:hypothetical protein